MSELTIDQTFGIAVGHHQAGQLAQAEAVYRHVLMRQPAHPGALHYLGLIAHHSGRSGVAVGLLRQAVACQPGNAPAWVDLGNALRDAGQLDEAIAACRQAIAINPQFPEAFNNLGNALTQKSQLNEAIDAYRQAIALRPDYAKAYSNLGAALTNKGQLDEAIAACRRALALQPQFSEAHYNLANALGRMGQTDEALAAYGQAVNLRPNYAEAYVSLGSTLIDVGRVGEAAAVMRQAIAVKPEYAAAYNGLANALRLLGQLDEAHALYGRAIALDPQFTEAQVNLGSALKDSGQMDEAIVVYRRALAIKPDFIECHSNLVFTLHFHPDFDAQAIAQEHRRWNDQHAEPLKRFIQPHSNDRDPDRRLRIGYVSPDFRAHVVGRNLLPLFQRHDHEQFEIICYSQVKLADEFTPQFQQHADGWRNIMGLSDEKVAEQIRADRIDILVDLTLHMAHNRLLVFARKPAPVQATFAGYPASTGLSAIDYRLGDPHLDPPGMDESIYSERTIRLADSFWCYDPFSAEPLVNELPAASSGFVTFGCLNNFCKTNAPLLKLWASVMHKTPNSRLILLASPGSARQWAGGILQAEGIELSRVQFEAGRSRDEYLRLYHQIDIVLDSLPYNGHTTSLDALWMGVPVVTLAGQTAVSRAGVSQLTNLGLPELIAHTPEQYTAIATDLAGDLERLSQLRSMLRGLMEHSPLMDAGRFAANIESAYRQMWRKWCATSEQ